MSRGKVVVGMSGGVDSSVAAWLLKEQGYDVIGVTMQIWQDEGREWQEENGGCCGLSAVDDARRVAGILGIPHYVMNFRREFQEHVIDYFVREYVHGRTPNPCIACNRYVKWEALLRRGMAIGADYLATGHYARRVRLANGRYSLQTCASGVKDQTYALYSLTQEQLKRTLLPVGEYDKGEIRRLARKLGLPVAHKPDSQDICFVPDGDYASLVERESGLTAAPGNFVTADGTVIGTHKGLIHYTVGQRKGLGLCVGEPVFVLALRPETNEAVVGSAQETYASHVRAEGISYMSVPELSAPRRAWAKIRYNHRGAWCTVQKTGADEILCSFDEPVRSPAPGQAAVLYDDEGRILLGGTITGKE